ncbi:MAG: aminoacyl-tRNA hydrolase [Desulfoarculaceae bacterium]|nr:aminoacyl-tRNA hydrolase [Desulfoarculaceae bacterium]
MNENMFLVVGLGNPGSEYAATRHNVGFMVVDELARRFGVSVDREKWQAHSAQVVLWGRQICFLKPVTFMNLSGKAVVRYVDFYKMRPDQIVVVHDDLDMAPGRVKLVAGGGTGGHNGIRSLVQCLGTKDFLRLKMGIGRPGRLSLCPGMSVEKYVLAPFAPDEKMLLEQRMDLIEKGLEYLVCDGVAKAMNLLNTMKQ